MANVFGSESDRPSNLLLLAGFTVLGLAVVAYIVAFILWPGDTFFWTALASVAWWFLRHPVASVILLLLGLSQ